MHKNLDRWNTNLNSKNMKPKILEDHYREDIGQVWLSWLQYWPIEERSNFDQDLKWRPFWGQNWPKMVPLYHKSIFIAMNHTEISLVITDQSGNIIRNHLWLEIWCFSTKFQTNIGFIRRPMKRFFIMRFPEKATRSRLLSGIFIIHRHRAFKKSMIAIVPFSVIKKCPADRLYIEETSIVK